MLIRKEGQESRYNIAIIKQLTLSNDFNDYNFTVSARNPNFGLNVSEQ